MCEERVGGGAVRHRGWRLSLPWIELKGIPAAALEMVSTLLDVDFICIALDFGNCCAGLLGHLPPIPISHDGISWSAVSYTLGSGYILSFHWASGMTLLSLQVLCMPRQVFALVDDGMLHHRLQKGCSVV